MNRGSFGRRVVVVLAVLLTAVFLGDPASAQKKPREGQQALAARQRKIVDANGQVHTRMEKFTQQERQAAADRLDAQVAPLANAACPDDVIAAGQLLIGPSGQLIPDYSGFCTPNYANSPMPRLVSTPGVEVSLGNPLIARQYASDSATNVLVINPVSLPVGRLVTFEVFNQVTGTNAPSAGKHFHLYVLRETAPGTFLVVHDTGDLTLPVVDSDQITNIPVEPPIEVQAGDRIAHYGQGIPLTIGTGVDVVSWPANTAPTAGNAFQVPSEAFPILNQARTYSIGARVIDMSQSVTTLEGGIRKFVDGLPGLTVAGSNNRGQYIPVAIPDTTTYPGSDYYEIELGEYSEQMHSDLPPTRLRGYRQTNTADATVSQFHYLGPLILATRGKPVRILFKNNLPTGAGGDLFIPVDTSVMGSGQGPLGDWASPADMACKASPDTCYSQNRAVIHLHGGVTPWISDGTTHQWVTPKGEEKPDDHYKRGASVAFVPDMWFRADGSTIAECGGMPTCAVAGATNDPGHGAYTHYYTNEQAARLMFYHDHAHGITRLNVYVGEAAGYLLTDQAEQQLLAAGVIPADQIPLIIQDKTFVDATTIRQQDPTWNWGTGVTQLYTDLQNQTMNLRVPVTGDLWWPHVYMPAQNPFDLSGANPMGRWHYGPWFWPPTLGIPYGPVPNPYYDCDQDCTRPWQPPEMPGTPNPSWGAEAFMDTPVVNGTAYPTITVEPKAYRFRILNAAHDRFWNLQLYKADPSVTTHDGRTLTEVKMVPATPNTGLPANWPVDGREGGVPDPNTVGPNWIQIGTEGGFLPKPVIVPNQPIAWNLDPTTFNFGNVSDHALLLGPAERADVIVDFSQYAGQTLILYNDAPAAFPALDARNDYYTGAPDLTETGGVAGVLPGFGPNIRTIMQIKVGGGQGASFDMAALTAAFAPDTSTTPARPGVFENAQDPIIVGQAAYNGVYTNNPTFPTTYPYWGVARIQDTASLSFETVQGYTTTTDIELKAIQDEMGETFDDYGRMSAKLGLTTPNVGRGFVLQGYNDPPTELIKLSNIATLIGQGPDGTQIWKITHNGVDTHPIHFHLFHVQLVNRVGWDGAIRLPDENELGWKDTVRISPLEDTIVAVRPIAPTRDELPAHWPELPNSWRLLNPSMPLGATFGFSNLDPAGNDAVITNQLTNFGWEYVWHCHILSHEENDMMRSVAFAFPPREPANLATALVGSGGNRRVRLTWTDNSATESAFEIQRALDVNFTAGVTTMFVGPNLTAYTDTTSNPTTPYRYRIRALNTVGSTIVGFPTITAESGWSNNADHLSPPVGPPAPSNLSGTGVRTSNKASVTLTWTDNANNETGFTLQRATNANFTGASSFNLAANTTTVTQTGLTRFVTYYFRIRANNGAVSSEWSNVHSITTP